MNREIKFRAYIHLDTGGIMMDEVTPYANGQIGFDEDEFKEQLPPKHHVDYDQEGVMHIDEEKDIDEKVLALLIGEDWIWLDENNFDLMQFTGMKDRNGKEIYEGDTVKYATGSPDKPFMEEEVEFRGAAFYPVSTMPSTEFEIIGNKYESPANKK